MSSLLQFDGHIGRGGVRLEFMRKGTWTGGYREENGVVVGERPRHVDAEPVSCAICGKAHPQVYVAWRKPRGMFGCWVVFAYNGEEHVPDLSLPIDVEKIPRDAKPLTPAENSALWHRE